MFCKQCNQENWSGATICAYCGASLTPENNAPRTSEPTYNPPTWDPTAGGTGYSSNDSGYSSNDSGWENTPVPKSNKKLWLLIPAIVVSIALIAFVAVKFLVARSPQTQLINSFSKTGEAFLNSVESAENFHALSQTVAQYRAADSVAADIKISIGNFDEILLSVAQDRSKNIFRADMGVDVEGYELDLVIGANKENLMLQLEQLNDKLYTLPLETFGVEYNDSALSDLLSSIIEDTEEIDSILSSLSINLFAKTDFATFLETNENARSFMESLVLEEVEENILDTTDLTVYRTTITIKDILDIYGEYYEYCLSLCIGQEAYEHLKELAGLSNVLLSPFAAGDLSEDISDFSLTIRFGINDDDCLTALYFCDAEDDESGFGIVLNGEKHIWDEVLIYEGYDVIGGISVTETDTGFVMDFFDILSGNRSTGFLITCDDEAGTLAFNDGYDDLFVINYDVDGKEATFGLEIIDEDVSIELTIEEGRTVSLPEGEEAPLMDFDQNDYMELVMDIVALFY